MTSIVLLTKAQVYSLDILWENESAGAETDREELCLQLAHTLRERDHDYGRSVVSLLDYAVLITICRSMPTSVSKLGRES